MPIRKNLTEPDQIRGCKSAGVLKLILSLKVDCGHIFLPAENFRLYGGNSSRSISRMVSEETQKVKW